MFVTHFKSSLMRGRFITPVFFCFGCKSFLFKFFLVKIFLSPKFLLNNFSGGGGGVSPLLNSKNGNVACQFIPEMEMRRCREIDRRWSILTVDQQAKLVAAFSRQALSSRFALLLLGWTFTGCATVPYSFYHSENTSKDDMVAQPIARPAWERIGLGWARLI